LYLLAFGWQLFKLESFTLKSGIYHIPLKLPWNSPGYVNVYLIEDNDGLVMIDCGVNGKEFLQLLESEVNKLNFNFGDIKLLIGTHMHSDHIGLSSSLRELDIPFALYKNSENFIDVYNDWSIRFKELHDYAKKEGAPKSFLENLSEIKTPSHSGVVKTPDILLEEGPVKFLNRKINTIFTPGHDITEISLFDESSKIIFSGDHILPRITPFIPTINQEEDLLTKYIESLDKVYNIEHDLIAPGHFGLIEEPHKRIGQMKLHHQRRSEKILNILKGKNINGWDIMLELFPRELDELNQRLAFQETMSHLKYLENKNLLFHDTSSSKSTWKLT